MFVNTNVALFTSLLGLVSAAPVPRGLYPRRVPQEHAHNDIIDVVRTNLNLNNPDKIQDPIFGLLGNAAASKGQGAITDTDCLQQATADQAFTNAKAAGDVAGMVAALQFRTLERNTGKVGLASVLCTAIKATNPEIAALSQHQDAASTGAAATNKALALELAKQIQSIGGDPNLAINAGTFAAGNVNDPTGTGGNICDTADDTAGCINSQKLLNPDVTVDEIAAAVGGVAAGGSAAATSPVVNAADPAATDAPASSCSLVPVTVTVTLPDSSTQAAATSTSAAAVATSVSSSAAAEATTSVAAAPASTTKAAAASTSVATSVAPAATSAAASASTGSDLQTFTGSLGGAPPPVTAGGRGFVVDGNDFLNIAAALGRSCDVQHNACANAANSGGGFSVNQCDTQNTACHAAAQ